MSQNKPQKYKADYDGKLIKDFEHSDFVEWITKVIQENAHLWRGIVALAEHKDRQKLKSANESDSLRPFIKEILKDSRVRDMILAEINVGRGQKFDSENKKFLF